MENKVLVKLMVPEINLSFDVFIPVNEVVWKVKKLILKSVSDLTGISVFNNSEYVLLNKSDSRVYSNNEIIIETNIRNGSELILISHTS